MGRPQGTNGRPQNNRSCRKEDSWRSAGLISAASAYSAGALSAENGTAFSPSRSSPSSAENRPSVRERRAGQMREAETEAEQGSRGGSGWVRIRKGAREGPHTGDARPCTRAPGSCSLRALWLHSPSLQASLLPGHCGAHTREVSAGHV